MALRILRYLVYGVIAFLGISLVLVFLFRFVPVPYTATMALDPNPVTRDWEPLGPQPGFARNFLFVAALVGGLLGCAIGSLCDGWTANSVAGGHGGGKFIVLQLAVSAEIIATGLFLSLMMGFLGGLFPSLAAMRMRPLEALR